MTADELARCSPRKNQRLHGFLRDQHAIAGLGRRLANEVCHRAKLSPFAMTGKLGVDGATTGRRRDPRRGRRGPRVRAHTARHELVEGSPRRRARPRRRSRARCAATSMRAVEYSGYTVNYCPTCQTGGKVLADNTTSKFLK